MEPVDTPGNQLLPSVHQLAPRSTQGRKRAPAGGTPLRPGASIEWSSNDALQRYRWVGPVTGWGAERLTREELLNLGTKLRSAWDASIRQANRRPNTSRRAWRHFATAAEMAELWGEAADELITRREARVQGTAACELECEC